MASTDPARAVTPVTAEDHCLVHHFIRTHGRRPTASELELLRRRTPFPPRRGGAWRARRALPQALRRRVASLVNRF